MTDQAFHDAYVRRTTTRRVPTHHASRPASSSLVMPTRGFRASGSAVTARASSAAARASAATSGMGRAPITMGSGYLAEIATAQRATTTAATTGATQRITTGLRARSDTDATVAIRCASVQPSVTTPSQLSAETRMPRWCSQVARNSEAVPSSSALCECRRKSGDVVLVVVGGQGHPQAVSAKAAHDPRPAQPRQDARGLIAWTSK